MANGLLGLKLTAPGVSANGQPNTGRVDFEVNLGHAPTMTKPATASSGTLPWFGSVDPAARITFGVYKSPIVNMRVRF